MRVLKAVDPTTGVVVREVSALDSGEMDQIVARAEAAQRVWRERTFAQRGSLLRAVAARLREQVDRFGAPMTEEMGKPVREARGEVRKSAWCADHYAAHAAEYLADEVIASDATESFVTYQPLGVVLGILPWNAPFWLAFRFCAPALMAGNACLVKHDAHVPECGRLLEVLFREAGAPEGLVSNLPLVREQIEGAIRHPVVQAVSFTGSTRAGAVVASVAASEIKPAVLELGGSDPAIVLEDADLDLAAEHITTMRILNAGQSCIAAKRILVHDAVHDAFVEKLRARMERLVVGDPRDDETDVGPIARADLRDNLHRQVRETVDAGARCVLGGELPVGEGFFYPVTLLVDVTPEMTACREETFGPVAAVVRVRDAEHALEIANDSPYGLGGSVWTKDVARGRVLALRVASGQVAVNGLVKTDPRLPSGGIKRSGYGRELGSHGIKEFVNAKQVWVGPRVG